MFAVGLKIMNLRGFEVEPCGTFLEIILIFWMLSLFLMSSCIHKDGILDGMCNLDR